ncbi:MAG: crotonase/enoyl-CoA hydratase family protein [Deltaproteobacteria bacterium]|nr:MAG: crotonase/enoyl-CoA hydratase family protein [Deltaproteobacteria bacterium]
MSNEHCIRIDRDGHVAEIVLDNPDRLNVMTLPGFFHEVRDAIREIGADDEVRVAIVRAEGRMFTAGLDLKSAGASFTGADGGSGASEATRNMSLYRTIRDLQDCFSEIERCPKPVIAAVHGKCIGGGLDLITACDIRLASADASFSIYETKIAIVADVGTLQRITAIIGKGMAREMAYTGAFVDAERALACGLVNRVYPDREALLAGARELAAEIASNSPLAVQGTKMVLNYSDEHTTDEGLEYVAQWNSSFFRSNDVVEAMSAFMEKRPPKFEGR